MRIKNITIRISDYTDASYRELYADDGMILTNGEIFGAVVSLAKNDEPERWREITIEEYETMLAETEATDESV